MVKATREDETTLKERVPGRSTAKECIWSDGYMKEREKGKGKREKGKRKREREKEEK